MELREPPRPQTPAAVDRTVRALLLAVLVAVLALVALVALRSPAGGSRQENQRRREVAAKLKAAGALDQAGALYAEVMADTTLPAEERAALALSLGTLLLEAGREPEALRWFYEAEALEPGKLGSAVSEKIVHTLERLGRVHQAQAALAGGVGLERATTAAPPAGDPVVATVAGEPLYRSEVEARLGELPPELAAELAKPEKRSEALRQVVANELLWRKARKLELDRDPKVQARLAELSRQLVVSALVEREILAKIAVDEVDLQSFFAANQARYSRPTASGQPGPAPDFAAVRPAVERDYRMTKAQAAYQKMLEEQLGAADVKLYPERMGDGR